MNIFGHHDDPKRSAWYDAPRWARKLGEMQLATMIQNEAILAKLEQRESKLSPEDQEKLNKIFDIASGDAAKIDKSLT